MIEKGFDGILGHPIKALYPLNCERLKNKNTSKPRKNCKQEKPIIDGPGKNRFQ